MRTRHILTLAILLGAAAPLRGNPPVASYIFPAGGQRGTAVPVKVGGLFLHDECGFELLGPGVRATPRLKRTATRWFEGPLLPLPDSQRAEDYPKDMAGRITLAADAPLGVRHWRLWTAQGATPARQFVVGELPEVVEDEIDGDPVPVKVALPITVNGRIFPREDVDVWTFAARRGQGVACVVHAARLGSPLDARLEVRDPHGRRLTESDDRRGADPALRFTAPEDGVYQVRIHDTRMQGGQAFVYRLTLTSGPHVEAIYPLGGRRGSTLRLALIGQAVPATVEVALPASAGPEFAYQVTADGQRSNVVHIDTDDLPEYDEAAAQSARTFPAVLNGRIARPGEIDAWTWHGTKGSALEFELRAARLGSPLDGVLTVADAAGKELARAESSGPNQPDARLRFNVPADGTYVVRVQDRFRSRGGPAFAYRLRVAPPPAPDFRLTLATDVVEVPRKGQAKLRLNVERLGGFKEPIALTIDHLPAGVKVAPLTIAGNQATVDLTFQADVAAPIRVAHLTVEGTAKGVRRRAVLKKSRGVPAIESVLLAVALPTPFVIKGEYVMGYAARGGVHRRRYKIERHGYDGPIEVSLTDRQARHLQGVTGPTVHVPPGATEFTYVATLPPWMETGRTCRVCVMGVGTVKEPDGRQHRVSFSSVNQNEQLVAIVNPGRLALDAARTSFTAAPGRTLAVPVRVKRGEGLRGPVRLELIVPAHVKGLSAVPTTVPADRDEGQLLIRCAESLPGPFNVPIVLRATLSRSDEPHTAEVKLDIQP